MSKYCPVRERYVLYLDCMECEEKECASPKHPTPIIAYKNNHEIDGIYENILDCSRHYNLAENTVRSSHKNNTTKGRSGYYFRKISKEEFYKLKEDAIYESKIIPYRNARRCEKITKYTA